MNRELGRFSFGREGRRAQRVETVGRYLEASKVKAKLCIEDDN
jgi:hypothetical protein